MVGYRTLLVLACLPALGRQYTISTVAGNGAAHAFFTNPTSVAVDRTGDVYVADWDGLIRKIWVRDGGFTIVAGNGLVGYSGDGGQAPAARIGQAISLALDSAGNLYFADGDNHRVRRVDALTGIITTVAGTGASVDSGDGGPALQAGVARPTGITVDGAGDLYFSSSWSRVRRVSARTGIIETIAGQMTTSFGADGGPVMSALFWDPIPSVVTNAGELLITDYENSRIRKVAADTGIVTTIAGSSSFTKGVPMFDALVCQGGFAGDGGPAPSALLNHAQAVALDSRGDLYIADTINHRIRRVDAETGIISTIAGNGANGFSGDGGRALAAGRVYFSDENNNRVRVLTPVIPRPSVLRLRPMPRR